MTLNEEWSATKEIFPNVEGPERFFILCSIRSNFLCKVLCDLGASINFMSLSIYTKLGLGHVKPTIVKLQ